GLRIHAVRSKEGGSHLFFRVRHQDSFMISLGPLAGRSDEVTLTVHYSGSLYPGPIEREVTEGLQGPATGLQQEQIPIEPVIVYTNRNAWYPQTATDDHALSRARFDVPEGYMAVTGGRRSAPRTEGDRTVVEYVQDRPGKYLSVAVGRL